MAQKEEVVLEIHVDYQKGLSAIGEYKEGIRQLKAEQEQYKKELDAGRISKDNYSKAVTDSKIRVKEFENAIRIVTKELQNNLKQEKAAENSMDGMKARLSNLTTAYGRLGDTQEDVAKKQKIGDEISSITEKLNKEEQSLGNFRRQVGNYEVATKSLRGELRELTEQLAAMKLEGKDGTEEYTQLVKKVSSVKDAMGDVNREVGGGASDTRGLDQVKGSVDLLAGSFTALNSIQGIFGEDSKKMEAIVQKIQIGIGALSAATAIQNGLQKEGAVMQGIFRMQSWAATKAIVAQTGATGGATVAQRIFNAVAKANPYVLLAMALITVVGALVAFAVGSETAAEKQEKLNRETESSLKYLDYKLDRLDQTHKAIIKNAETELSLARAKGASASELEKLEVALYTAKKNRNIAMSTMANSVVGDLDKNIAQMDYLQNRLIELEKNKGDGIKPSLRIDGKILYMEYEDAIKECQKQIELNGSKIEVGMRTKNETDSDNVEEALRKATADKAVNDRAIELSKERKQKEIEAVRAMEDAVLNLKKEGQEKEIEQTNLTYTRQIADLQNKLKTETNLSVKAKEALSAQIKALESQQTQELEKINKQYSQQAFDNEVARVQAVWEAKLTTVKEGSQEEFDIRMSELAGLEQAELESNRRKIEGQQIDEQLIIDKYAFLRMDKEKERKNLILNQATEEMQLRLENEIMFAEQFNGDVLAVKLAAKQTEIEELQRLEGEADAEYLNRKLKLAGEEKEIMRDIANAKQQQLEDTLTAFGSLANSLGQIFESMGEDNEAMASFSKAMAIFEIGINTAKAISSAVAAGSKLGIIGIVSTVATVIASIAQATQILNKQKEPKAPKINKYASGGLVSGPGSGTSDNVPSMLSNGESVMTALTTSMFAPILSSFNQIGGGVPIQIQQTGSQVMGEDMLARAFAKGAASLPAPVVSVEEINRNQARTVQIEQLRTI